MKRMLKTLITVAGLLGASSLAIAKWLPVHQVASEKPLYLIDGDTGASYTPSDGNASSNWQAGTKEGFSHAIGLTTGGQYEFRLIDVQSSDDGSIEGLWDIYHDGILKCDDCVGKAYGLDGAIGDYFKIYVGSPAGYAERWHYSGYITRRFDY